MILGDIAILGDNDIVMQLDDASRPELWRKAFDQDTFADKSSARDRFKRALLDMEGRAGLLANEIASDMPEFTQHDISHTHTLWEIANHIAGPELNLNPAEAYVLGGAILVHDLAMSRAAHQLAGKNLRDRREWPDALANEIRKARGRPPHPLELASPPDDLAVKADKYLLRLLHAEVAQELPLISWTALDKSTEYLINDPELRQAYGRIIGRVAASHHWNSDEVTRSLSSPVGAPGFAPIDWRVDTLVLACLLRTADAAHLDATRSPSLLAAVRGLPPLSNDHWLFQARVQRPYLKNGRLVFTAPDGFSSGEMSAWWLAYETLSMVDEELRNTDSVLADSGRSTFSARGVANVESPKAFSVVAPCREWEPVEAKVKVDDVAGLVRRLGGNELYGENWTVALREIATNACDAVKAREALADYRGGRPFAGRVTVWLEKDSDEVWLSCNDNGIGMTSAILGGKLLDFGNTSWLSSDVVRENPGLLASKFEPSGRFGIGFFSVFMMGRRVQVISRPVSAGPADTWVLEFSDGVEHRPILRKATHDEQLEDPGTTVRVQLDEDICSEVFTKEKGGFLQARIHRMAWRITERISLVTLIRYLMPASEVDIWASDHLGGRETECAVAKHEWIAMDGVKLMRRMLALPENGLDADDRLNMDDDVDPWDGKDLADEISTHVGGMLKIVNDVHGMPAGRIAMCDPEMLEIDLSYPTVSVVTAGPARTSTSLQNVAGILLGRPDGAAREFAVPVASLSSMGGWVEGEMERISALADDAQEGWPVVLAELVWKLDRDAQHLPCWRTRQGWIDYSELVRWISGRSEFYVAEPYYFRVEVGAEDLVADLNDDVLSFEMGRNVYLSGGANSSDWPANIKHGPRQAYMYMFGRAVKEAWGVEPEDVYTFFRRSRARHMEAGRFQGRPIVVPVHPIIRQPAAE
ncbi:HD domain-containing protein [Streptomyces malaysiensis]|uniref:HD domain-containing protein n=1 Tax=Streptomyces malaysiensis TaxID=92644 RepID=UPI0036BFF78D